MVLGYALIEQFIMDEGKTLNNSFLDYKMAHAIGMPESEYVCVPSHEPEGPYSTKEAGEKPVIQNIKP